MLLLAQLGLLISDVCVAGKNAGCLWHFSPSRAQFMYDALFRATSARLAARWPKRGEHGAKKRMASTTASERKMAAAAATAARDRYRATARWKRNTRSQSVIASLAKRPRWCASCSHIVPQHFREARPIHARVFANCFVRLFLFRSFVRFKSTPIRYSSPYIP